jgi:hypothetical protein
MRRGFGQGGASLGGQARRAMQFNKANPTKLYFRLNLSQLWREARFWRILFASPEPLWFVA